LSLCATNGRAKICLWGLTKDAARLATLRRVGWNYMIPRFDRGNSFTDTLHNASSFVAEDGGEKTLIIFHDCHERRKCVTDN